jgi:hypothetical protein
MNVLPSLYHSLQYPCHPDQVLGLRDTAMRPSEINASFIGL